MQHASGDQVSIFEVFLPPKKCETNKCLNGREKLSSGALIRQQVTSRIAIVCTGAIEISELRLDGIHQYSWHYRRNMLIHPGLFMG